MSTPPAGNARLLPMNAAGMVMDLRLLAAHEAHFGPLPVVQDATHGKPGPLDQLYCVLKGK